MNDLKEVIEYKNKQDSLELTRDKAGKYAWKIKVYFDSDSGVEDVTTVLDKVKEVDAALQVAYPG